MLCVCDSQAIIHFLHIVLHMNIVAQGDLKYPHPASKTRSRFDFLFTIRCPQLHYGQVRWHIFIRTFSRRASSRSFRSKYGTYTQSCLPYRLMSSSWLTNSIHVFLLKLRSWASKTKVGFDVSSASVPQQKQSQDASNSQ